MQNSIVIKGSKSGMTVNLDARVPFEQIISDITRKFRESAKFWGSVQLTLTIEGRELTALEELEVVNAITENSEIEILCLVDTNADRILRCEKALNDKLMDLSSQTGQFHKGALQRGDVLESETSIVVIGDVKQGAKVIAKGNVIVLGNIYGIVHAGVAGNADSVIAAFQFSPVQLRIHEYATPLIKKGRCISRGFSTAYVENKKICIKPLKKTFLERLNFN